MRDLSQNSSLRVQRPEKQQDALLPFFVSRDCAYCFDSVDDEQDMEEGSVHGCEPLGGQDASHPTAESTRGLEWLLTRNLQPNWFSEE